MNKNQSTIENPRRRDFLKMAAIGATASLISCDTPNAPEFVYSADAMIICLADLHSCYHNLPRLATAIAGIASQANGYVVVAVNGDIFEKGNPAALRSGGAPDLAFLRRIQSFADQVVVNIGNHEGDMSNNMSEIVALLEQNNITVVSNIKTPGGNGWLAKPAHTITTPRGTIQITGIATDDLSTYPEVHRTAWEFPEARQYIQSELPQYLRTSPAVNLVMCHDGVATDKSLLESLPVNTVVLGGHDHVRFVQRSGNSVALHTGWWGERFDVVGVRFERSEAIISWQSQLITPGTPLDPVVGAAVSQAENEFLAAEEKNVVAQVPRSLSNAASMAQCVLFAKMAAGTDAACINNTTFGAPFSVGPLRLYDLLSIVRFDGPMLATTVSGIQLQQIAARANQYTLPNWNNSTGEYPVGSFPATISPSATYTLAVNAWIAANQERFLGLQGLAFAPLPSVPSIQQAVIDGLQ